MMKYLASLLFACTFATASWAAPRPVVVELFTSQSCSSCPPADALLRQLKAQDPDILPLDLHVTYWNNTGWKDQFSLDAATQRQNNYASLHHSSDVYTPEDVIDGGAQLVGSDRRAVIRAIKAAEAAAQHAVVDISFNQQAGQRQINLTAAAHPVDGTIYLFSFDSTDTTPIGGGENAGATLTEVNVVRSIANLGRYTGSAMSLAAPSHIGKHEAVLVQQDDGTILGAAMD
jgi:hypothetical protein